MAQRGNAGARVGDATGRERERLQKEHADEIRAGAEHLTTINPPPDNEPDGSVIDYSDGSDLTSSDGVRMLSLEDVQADESVTMPDILDEGSIDLDSLPTGEEIDGDPRMVTRPEEPQPMQPRGARPGGARAGGIKAAQVMPGVEIPVVAKPTHRVLRVNEDLEEVTIGKGRTRTFKTGQYYKVEADVYDHLNEKGFVYH